MARPTVWRRSFNVTIGVAQGTGGSLDLLTVQPGETLGGVWWSYTMKSLGNAPQTTTSPLQDSVSVMGLILQPEQDVPANPLATPGGPWLWWEQVGFEHVLYDPNQGAWFNYARSGIDQRKAKGMRRNEGSGNELLRVCWETYVNSAGTQETQFAVTASASALIILP